MAERIVWTTNVAVQNGLTFAVGSSVETEVYETYQITVRANQEEVAEILPAHVRAKFLLIKANKYVGEDPLTQKLTYRTGGDPTDLTGPLVLSNGAAIGLLDADLSSITFTNSMETDVQVEIVVARDAGPVPV